MKRMLTALSLSILSLFHLGCAKSKARQLSVEEVEAALQRKDVYFLDVRPAWEIASSGTLAGYHNIPLDQLQARLNEIPKDKPILTACAVGARAAKAAEILEANGYNVIGCCGVMQWRLKGKPVIYPKAD